MVLRYVILLSFLWLSHRGVCAQTIGLPTAFTSSVDSGKRFATDASVIYSDHLATYAKDYDLSYIGSSTKIPTYKVTGNLLRLQNTFQLNINVYCCDETHKMRDVITFSSLNIRYDELRNKLEESAVKLLSSLKEIDPKFSSLLEKLEQAFARCQSYIEEASISHSLPSYEKMINALKTFRELSNEVKSKATPADREHIAELDRKIEKYLLGFFSDKIILEIEQLNNEFKSLYLSDAYRDQVVNRQALEDKASKLRNISTRLESREAKDNHRFATRQLLLAYVQLIDVFELTDQSNKADYYRVLYNSLQKEFRP